MRGTDAVPGFVKTHADATLAATVLLRAEALRRGGVPTPAARAGGRPADVAFDRLTGETGPALAGDLAALLRPLAQLHACPVPGVGPYDPFLRIRPRLADVTAHPMRHVLGEAVPGGTATLHGDVHLGQFIRDASGRVWIIDLDDLALGPPEADLANFAAYLATSLDGGLAQWSHRVRAAWRNIGQTCDNEVFKRFLRFALVRRHLKLRQAGRPDFEAMVTGHLRDSSNFSIL